MHNNDFDKIEEVVEQLINKIDLLVSENTSLKEELTNLKNNHQEEANLIEELKKEKEGLVKKIEQPQPDKHKEEEIKNHIDSILKKLEELQLTIQ